MALIADWVKCTVTAAPGTGDIIISNTAPTGYIPLSIGIPASGFISYSVIDGNNREQGFGSYQDNADGTSTIYRESITATLLNGTYDNTAPTAISLTANAIVSINASSDNVGRVLGTGYAQLSTAVDVTSVYSDTSLAPANGAIILTATYTPKSIYSLLQIEGGVIGTSGAAQKVMSYLNYRHGSSASTSGGACVKNLASGDTSDFRCYAEYESESLQLFTVELKVQCFASSAHFYVNSVGTNTTNSNGGKNATYIKITEIRQ